MTAVAVSWALHVLAIVDWIGGVALVTLELLLGLHRWFDERAIKADADPVDDGQEPKMLECIDRSTIASGASQ